MKGYLQAVSESFAEVSTNEIVGGLLIGLTLSLVASGLWMLGRKRVSDPLPVLCGLILAVSALSMAFGVGHSRFMAERERASRWAAGIPQAHHFRMPGHSIGRLLLKEADLNKDGQLTAEEAAEFVKGADRAGKGWINASDLDRVDRAWAEPGPSPQQHRPDLAPRYQGRTGL